MELTIKIIFMLSLSFIRGFSQEVSGNLESLPEFPGGQQEIYSFINKNIERVKFEYYHGIQGKVEISFVIDTDGTVTNVKLYKGLKYGTGYNKEAVRVVTLLPKWKPAFKNGKPIQFQFILPISFTTPYEPTPSVTEAQRGHPEELIAEIAKAYEPEPVWTRDSLLQVSKSLTIQEYIVPPNQWWGFVIISSTIFNHNVACGCLKTLTKENTSIAFYNNLSIYITFPSKPEIHLYFTPDNNVLCDYGNFNLPFKTPPGTIIHIEGTGCQVPIAIFQKQ